MADREAHVIVSGRVQGVWFRASTKEAADRVGARGWVRNLPDGRVEALIQGSEEQVRAVIDFMKVGPPGARVEDIQVVWKEPDQVYDSFSITYA
ncbi:MAG: acylphosphatase [Deltaproteobacteria bacterium]|nr:MAG: acylphosphatase [Deltaproteobacteria bacterium]